MDHNAAASQLIRSLRGKRSQTVLSRRLGYKSNTLYLWEAGRNFPSAARTLALAKRVGIEPADAIARFFTKPAPWVSQTDFTTSEGVAMLLNDLRGRKSIAEVARLMKRDRYAVTRWMKGSAQPRLPDFFQLIQVCTLRLLDFISCFVDPGKLAATKRTWARLCAARATVSDAPWSQAVIHALELEEYKALARHQVGWLASRVGITEAEEERSLKLLSRAGQVRWNGKRWLPRALSTVDTRPDAGASRKLARWCAELGAERLSVGLPGNFAFNVFAVSEDDLLRLRQLQRDYFNQLRDIVADSPRAERLVVANMQLFALDGG